MCDHGNEGAFTDFNILSWNYSTERYDTSGFDTHRTHSLLVLGLHVEKKHLGYHQTHLLKLVLEYVNQYCERKAQQLLQFVKTFLECSLGEHCLQGSDKTGNGALIKQQLCPMLTCKTV